MPDAEGPNDGSTTSTTDVVRAFFTSYRTQDREAAERLATDEFVFTSPQDDHIDRAAYFERCFPTADRFRSQSLLYVVAASNDDVLVVYEYELTTGGTYRNAELLTVRDGKVVEAQVFFGGPAEGQEPAS